MPAAARIQIFDGPNQPLRLKSHALPTALAPGEILVEIQLATICGSDLHTLAGHRNEPTPCILGHEAVGRIIDLGTDQRDLTIGDRLTWSIADSCGTCPACTEHRLPEKCHHLFKYGHAALDDGCGLNGCYASHILLRPGTHVVKIPDSLADALVAPANCALATVINAAAHLPDPCRAAVIQGAGLLGIYACALLKERGVEHIFCIDINEKRLAQVARFGATPIDGRPEYYNQRCDQIAAAAPNGVDAVLEVAGVSALIPEGLHYLRPGGYYAFVGMVHPNTALDLSGEQIIRKCLHIRGIHNYSPWHLEEAIAFLAKTADKYPYSSLVSPPHPLSALEEAVQLAQSQQYFRVAVQPQEQS